MGVNVCMAFVSAIRSAVGLPTGGLGFAICVAIMFPVCLAVIEVWAYLSTQIV